MNGNKQFLSYKNFEELTYNDLKLAVNYICGQLNSSTRSYPYWYDMYSYTTESFIVMRFRKKMALKNMQDLGKRSVMQKL